MQDAIIGQGDSFYRMGFNVNQKRCHADCNGGISDLS